MSVDPATVLARRLLRHVAFYCELTPDRGVTPRHNGGCPGEASAVKVEDGFSDVVCEQHGRSAEQRGALVFWLAGNSKDD